MGNIDALYCDEFLKSELYMVKTIIFDLDGTLIDSLADIHAALNKVLTMRGATPLDMVTVRNFIGEGSANLVMRALTVKKLPNDVDSCAAGLSDFLRIYSEQAAKLTYVFDGARDSLIQLNDQNFNLGICTNKPSRPTKIVLDQFELSGFFQNILAVINLPAGSLVQKCYIMQCRR